MVEMLTRISILYVIIIKNHQIHLKATKDFKAGADQELIGSGLAQSPCRDDSRPIAVWSLVQTSHVTQTDVEWL